MVQTMGQLDSKNSKRARVLSFRTLWQVLGDAAAERVSRAHAASAAFGDSTPAGPEILRSLLKSPLSSD